MSRRVLARAQVFDVITLWASDLDKLAGVAAENFSVRVLRDGELVDLDVTISEVDGSPGDYRVEVIFPTAAFYEIEVVHEASRTVSANVFDVEEPKLSLGARPPGG